MDDVVAVTAGECECQRDAGGVGDQVVLAARPASVDRARPGLRLSFNVLTWEESSDDRQPVVGAPTGITFVGYENPPGVTTEQRVRHFVESDRAAWHNLVNLSAHDCGGHFIP